MDDASLSLAIGTPTPPPPSEKSRASNGTLQIGQRRSRTPFPDTMVGVPIPLRLQRATSMEPTGSALNSNGFNFPIVHIIVYSLEKFSCWDK